MFQHRCGWCAHFEPSGTTKGEVDNGECYRHPPSCLAAGDYEGNCGSQWDSRPYVKVDERACGEFKMLANHLVTCPSCYYIHNERVCPNCSTGVSTGAPGGATMGHP